MRQYFRGLTWDHPRGYRALEAAALSTNDLLRWSRNMTRPGFRYDNLGRLYDLVRARPAMQEVYRTEGIA